MPELPEVETVRAGLEQHVVGRTVATAAVLNPRAVRRDPAGPAGFTAAMIGRTFTRAERRGKYLWFALDDDEALLAHLGMSGQLLVGEPDRELSSHVRARFTFTDGGPDLRFTDQRTFGHLMVAPLVPAIKASPDDDPVPAALDLVPEPISHIAPDPLEAAFDPARVRRAAGPPQDRDQARAARPVADQRDRQHLRRRGAVAGPAALGPADRDAPQGRGVPAARRRSTTCCRRRSRPAARRSTRST